MSTPVTLADGFKVGDVIHREAVLRLPTAGDVLEAGLESERCVPTPEGYQLLMSPTLISQHVLRRQVVRIGDHAGPLTLAELKLLTQRDLQALQMAAAALDSALEKRLAQVIEQRGRDSAPSEGAGGR